MAKSIIPILHCKVNCCTQALAELEIDDSLWIPGVILFSEIAMIRASSERDVGNIGDCTSVTMKSGNAVLIDIPYEQTAFLWTTWLQIPL